MTAGGGGDRSFCTPVPVAVAEAVSAGDGRSRQDILRDDRRGKLGVKCLLFGSVVPDAPFVLATVITAAAGWCWPRPL